MPEGHAERRLITAMFIDIVGSSDLVTLGPERMKRVLDRFFADLSAEIAAEGGTVEKYIGDAIFAIFGAPVSHEDDALRALRAAGRCLAKAGTATDGRPAIPIRIGVETGDALVDLAAAQTDRQRMAVGGCVNVATRLQSVAAPGTALVGPGTHEVVGDAAALEPIGDVELKGLGRSAGWRLTAAPEAHLRPRVAYVGRASELEILELALRRARAGRTVLAVVSGPAGQGKSRIVEELIERTGLAASRIIARCRPAGEVGPLEPLRQLLDARDAAAVKVRVDQVIADPAEAERVANALAHSAGLDASDALRGIPIADRQDEITNAWRRYLAALARERPVIVWIDDVHWADPQIVELIDRLTQSGTAPILFVVTARPEFAQHAGLRPTGQRFFIDLDPLDPSEARALAALAGGMADPITGRAEGNPLFIIELARARSRLDDALPMTLRGTIGARLDDLPEGERQMLQAAAVVGESFTAKDAAVLFARDLGEVRVVLDRLVELLYLRSTDEGVYRFHHGLVREIAYGQLPIAERLRLHARFARLGLAADDHERRAHHLWEAVGGPDAAWVWEDPAEHSRLRAEAREALLAAARANGQAFLTDAAIVRAERALELADGAFDRAEADRVLGEIYEIAVAGDEALEHLTRAIAEYREAGVTPPARVYAAIADVVWRPGGMRTLLNSAEIDRLLAEGLTVARAEGNALAEAGVLAALAIRTGPNEPKRELMDQVRAITDRAADPVPFVEIIGLLASYESIMGNAAGAKKLLSRGHELAAQDPSARTDILYMQSGTNAFQLGDLDELEANTSRYERSVAAAGPHLRMHAQRGRALIGFCRADWARVREVARHVGRTIDEHPETVFCIAAALPLANGAIAAAISGDLVEARDLLSRARRIATQPNTTEAPIADALGALGLRGDLLRIDDAAADDAWPGALATGLALIDEWDRVRRRLPALERGAANSDVFAGALAAALREELAARDGGPAPQHAALREMGYVGFSELLRFRPNGEA